MGGVGAGVMEGVMAGRLDEAGPLEEGDGEGEFAF